MKWVGLIICGVIWQLIKFISWLRSVVHTIGKEINRREEDGKEDLYLMEQMEKNSKLTINTYTTTRKFKKSLELNLLPTL